MEHESKKTNMRPLRDTTVLLLFFGISETLKFYEKVLNYCYEKGAWMTSGEEIWKWWRKYKG